jgi:hypothetical protein
LYSDFYPNEIDPESPQSATTIIFEDNQSCRDIVNNQILSWRTKHIDVKYFYIRELITKKIIGVQLVSTSNQVADILTKSLPKTAHRKLVESLGLIGQ